MRRNNGLSYHNFIHLKGVSCRERNQSEKLKNREDKLPMNKSQSRKTNTRVGVSNNVFLVDTTCHISLSVHRKYNCVPLIYVYFHSFKNLFF